MREMASAYRGPNQVILNRNEKNLRIAGHLNKVISMARGEILIGAAGDDASFKNRSERIYQAWVESGGKAFSIYSRMIEIDAGGAEKGLWNGGVPIHPTSVSQMLGRASAGVYGFSHAYHRKIFEVFGPLDDRVLYECVAIPFRSLLLGNIAFIPGGAGLLSKTWKQHMGRPDHSSHIGKEAPNSAHGSILPGDLAERFAESEPSRHPIRGRKRRIADGSH